MTTPHGRISQHTGMYRYAHQTISFTYWSHLQGNEPPDTIIFLGTGQLKRIGRWAAQAAPAGTVVIEGAPHWHAHPSAEGVYDFMYLYTRSALRIALQKFNLSSAHLVAHSQAAPGVVKLATSYPDMVGNIILASPLGFTATIFGETPQARFRTLLKRTFKSLVQLSQSPLYDPRNIYAGYTILRSLSREAERGASRKKFTAGLSYDMVEDFRKLAESQAAQHKTTTLLLGEKDKVFTAKEIRTLVEAANIKHANIEVLRGLSHVSLGARGGKKLLATAIHIARTQRKD